MDCCLIGKTCFPCSFRALSSVDKWGLQTPFSNNAVPWPWWGVAAGTGQSSAPITLLWEGGLEPGQGEGNGLVRRRWAVEALTVSSVSDGRVSLVWGSVVPLTPDLPSVVQAHPQVLPIDVGCPGLCLWVGQWLGIWKSSRCGSSCHLPPNLCPSMPP